MCGTSPLALYAAIFKHFSSSQVLRQGGVGITPADTFSRMFADRHLFNEPYPQEQGQQGSSPNEGEISSEWRMVLKLTPLLRWEFSLKRGSVPSSLKFIAVPLSTAHAVLGIVNVLKKRCSAPILPQKYPIKQELKLNVVKYGQIFKKWEKKDLSRQKIVPEN